ncbi:MAG: cadmium-translocating P-type ATPase [Actinomycetota bacterium]
MPKPQLVELDIEGMTCTACARRVERNLNKLEGVSAYVDFATEKAHLQISNATSLGLITTAVESSGYRVGEGRSELQTLKPRLIVGAVLSLLAMAFAMAPALSFPGVHYLIWALATPVFFYVAFPFHYAAIKNLRHLDTTMDTLVSLGSSVAYGYSVYLVLAGEMHSYFEVAAVVPAVVLLGRYIEVKARRSATDSVRALLSAIPDSATIERNGTRFRVATHEVKQGDVVLIAAGERIPVDGKLLGLHAQIDSSTITGESLPVEAKQGDLLSAGATSLLGEIAIEAAGSAAVSRLARIADLVREATSQKTKLASLADRVSSFFVPAVIVIAIGTFLVWYLTTSDTERAFTAAVAVLIIACPCALGIAVPMSLVVATSIGTKKSIVIRNPDSLSLLAKVSKVVFDKTGTLTDGELRVVNSRGLGGVGTATMLAYAAAVEKGSNHPVARAISRLSGQFVATDIKEVAGYGLSGWVDGKEISLGKPGTYQNQDELDQALAAAGPNSLVVVSWEGWAHGLIELSDQLRPSAKAAVLLLGDLDINVAILSGDNRARVESIANDLGITDFVGGVTPEGKLDYLRSQKQVTAMVGDGINDVAALAAADVGIAMGSGAHAAQAAAAITILNDDPEAIAFSLKLAKQTHKNILQNLGWAFGYNILLIPVAALGLLNPLLAGTAMAFSSVSVVVNAMRLKWQDR